MQIPANDKVRLDKSVAPVASGQDDTVQELKRIIDEWVVPVLVDSFIKQKYITGNAKPIPSDRKHLT